MLAIEIVKQLIRGDGQLKEERMVQEFGESIERELEKCF
jgi:hypothetical protein